jgi:Tetratricopeptide repeat
MKRGLTIALVVAGCLGLQAQTTPAGGGAAGADQSAPAAKQPQGGANPFPENTGNVPVLTPNIPQALPGGTQYQQVRLPSGDPDPVRSPDDPDSFTEEGEQQNYSSSRTGLADLLPAPDNSKPGKNSAIAPEPVETAHEDISVGNFYLDNHNWRGALSRFQSAMVLAPDNPEVYWGLAECERHLGNFADARTYYQKVALYDPDSRHGKDARKALRDPEIANAQKQPPAKASPESPQ